MATHARPSSVAPPLGAAVTAGILGGILIDAFLALMMHTSPIGIWQFVASTIVGKVAFTAPAYAVLGVAVHLVVSILWALVYAYAATALGALKQWLLGAIVLGVVVDAAMELLLQVKIGQPFAPAFEQGLLAHVVFYALPVAWYLARSARRV